MGLSFEALPGSYPQKIILTLLCDVCGVDLASFTHENGFIGAFHKAIEAGWKESAIGDRCFSGPCCSGKIKARTHAGNSDNRLV